MAAVIVIPCWWLFRLHWAFMADSWHLQRQVFCRPNNTKQACCIFSTVQCVLRPGKSLHVCIPHFQHPAYYGYYVEGGALEIGRSSTKAVVVSCVSILGADYVLAALLLH